MEWLLDNTLSLVCQIRVRVQHERSNFSKTCIDLESLEKHISISMSECASDIDIEHRCFKKNENQSNKFFS